MTGRYVVLALLSGDPLEFERPDEFAQALKAARRFRDAHAHRRGFGLLVYNDNTYDVDEGVFNDGLTEDEREQVEALEWEATP